MKFSEYIKSSNFVDLSEPVLLSLAIDSREFLYGGAEYWVKSTKFEGQSQFEIPVYLYSQRKSGKKIIYSRDGDSLLATRSKKLLNEFMNLYTNLLEKTDMNGALIPPIDKVIFLVRRRGTGFRAEFEVSVIEVIDDNSQ